MGVCASKEPSAESPFPPTKKCVPNKVFFCVAARGSSDMRCFPICVVVAASLVVVDAVPVLGNWDPLAPGAYHAHVHGKGPHRGSACGFGDLGAWAFHKYTNDRYHAKVKGVYTRTRLDVGTYMVGAACT